METIKATKEQVAKLHKEVDDHIYWAEHGTGALFPVVIGKWEYDGIKRLEERIREQDFMLKWFEKVNPGQYREAYCEGICNTVRAREKTPHALNLVKNTGPQEAKIATPVLSTNKPRRGRLPKKLISVINGRIATAPRVRDDGLSDDFRAFLKRVRGRTDHHENA